MRTEHLYYFVKAVDRHSLTTAANELFISQQALSTAIKNLEKEFHTQLLIRHRRGVSLTEEGQYFYAVARKMLSLHQELNEHFLTHETYSYATLSIAINTRAKDHFFPKVISYFYKEYPQFQITYQNLLNPDIIASVASGEAELGILPMVSVDGTYLSALDSSLQFEPFASYGCELACGKASPLACYRTVSISTVLKYPIILNIQADAESDLFYQLISHYSDAADIIYADSYALQNQMAADNVGNILTTRQVTNTFESLQHVAITNNIRIANGFLINTDHASNPLLTFYMEKARSLFPAD